MSLVYIAEFWTGQKQALTAESFRDAFERLYGPVTDTGYTDTGVWFSAPDMSAPVPTGFVMNNQGDFVATITGAKNAA